MAKKRSMTILFVTVFVLALLLPTFFTLAHAAGQEVVNEPSYVRKGIVTANGLNYREEPSTNSKVIAVLPHGTTVTILEDCGDWYRVEYNATTGYLYKEHVECLFASGVITASRLNVRSEPTVNSFSLGTLLKGARIEILEEVHSTDPDNPVWFKISYLDGYAYVSKQYVKLMTNPDGSYRKVGITTASVLNCRSDPNVLSKTLDRITKGTYVIVLDIKSTNDFYRTWYKIEYEGKTAWVAARYVSLLDWSEKPAATARTSSPSSGKNRNHNMKLASSTLSGTIVLPGEKFSWIKTMGSCSESKGYLIATVFVNGEIAEGAGGGVCQVSTTFNMAVKKLNITTEAHQHSLPVSYAKRSDEASVSYPYVDFSFTNTLDKPILVEYVTNGGTVVCNIYIAE